MDIVERLRTEQPSYVLIGDAAIEIDRLREAAKDRPKDRPNDAADEIERLRLREETLSGIIDGMTARFIEAQKAVEEIERLRKDYALAWENHLLHEQIFVLTEAKIERQQKALQWIAGCEGGDIFDMCKEMRDTANAALKEGE